MSSVNCDKSDDNFWVGGAMVSWHCFSDQPLCRQPPSCLQACIEHMPKRTHDFTMEGIHRSESMNFPKLGRTRGSERQKSPSGIQGQSPGRGSEEQSPQKLKQKVKLMCNCQRFPVAYLEFNE